MPTIVARWVSLLGLILGALALGCGQSTPTATHVAPPASQPADAPALPAPASAPEPAGSTPLSSSGNAGASAEPPETETETASASRATSDTPSSSAEQPASEPSTPAVLELELPEELDHTRPVPLADLRRERDATVWRKENLAQEHERSLVRLWDQLIAANRLPDGDPFAVLGNQTFDTLTVGMAGPYEPLRWGAEVAICDQAAEDWTQHEWRQRLAALRAAGHRIVQTEWHHAKFDESSETGNRSTVTFAIYGEQPSESVRWVLYGDLQIVWHTSRDAEGLPIPATINAVGVKLLRRQGPLGFREILTVDHATPDNRSGVQPVLVQDLNGDGRSEIVLAGSNELYWNRGENRFERDTLCATPEPGFETALLADVTGDGHLDYVRPGVAGDLLLYVGDGSGRFATAPLGRAQGGGPLRQPQVITAGDIDRDGDLDLWIGQYKISYVQGQMPTPYYDANDGFPAYLLINEGEGRFAPRTEEAGLGPKQFRRSYGGSFVDFDRDGDLDLIVVSDFAGVDLYTNDGQGYFTDVTNSAVDERHLFGMALTFADYNRDGRLDFFATGMASTTARRLEYMRLGRRDRADIHLMRSKMGYGNRMYLATDDGFSQPEFRDQVARTGWTWGATSLDVDNDSFPEIFVANGHSSGQSTKDHCSHFWCHDIYDGSSEPNREVLQVFNSVMRGYFDRSESWDGYQKNVLLANLDGHSFVNLAFVLGVGHEYDGRAVVSDDLDGDGRLDLLVVEDLWNEGQRLHVYRNELQSTHHWIAVQLVEKPGRASPLGATVIARLPDGSTRIACITAGDSIHAQHATAVHFGLGEVTAVDGLEVHLASGDVLRIDHPAVDQVHRVDVE